MRHFVVSVLMLCGLLAATVGVRAQSLEQIRRDFAQTVYQDSSPDINRDAPQPLLRAVVVLRIRMNEAGRWAAEVMRDNDLEPALTRKAIASVEHLAPPAQVEPALVDELHRDGFVEVWLFQNDSRFALKTLALPQRGL